MPDFENIDQYESQSPGSGKKRIVPIAPHSMQAVDYRPVKRSGGQPAERKKSPPYKAVQVEPVSIRQMEKEFRQAARTDARRQGRSGLSGLWKALREFLGSLFGSKNKKPRRKHQSGGPRQRGKSRRPQGKRKPRPDGGNSPEQGKPSSGNRSRRRNRSNRNRPDNRDKGKNPNRQQGKDESKSDNPKPEGGGSRSRNRSRGRRGRRPRGGGGNGPSGGGQAGGQDKSNQKNQ